MTRVAEYFLPQGYRERLEPQYFDDEAMDAVWQPDVYAEAAALARVFDTRRIVDLGCGDGSKLVALHPEFEIVGIDVGANLERAREHGVGTWIELDLDSGGPLPIGGCASTLFICADVIEHLVHPELTLAQIRDALSNGADALVLSTPERDLNGADRAGPPANPAHVREWNRDELLRFLAAQGLDGLAALTRSNDYHDRLLTTLVVVPGVGEERRRVVQLWATLREPWERRAAEAADKLARERERVEAFAAAADHYKAEVERHGAVLSEVEHALAESERGRVAAEALAEKLAQPRRALRSLAFAAKSRVRGALPQRSRQ